VKTLVDMSKQHEKLTAKTQAILPYNKKNDRPLFMVLVILAFLATLTLLATASGYRAATGWQNNLQGKLTVQIKPNIGNLNKTTDEAERAKVILTQLDPVVLVTILPLEHSQALLQPWLGDAPLPDDLPLPILLDVQLISGQSIDTKQATALLQAAGIRADIDDHSQWDEEIKRTTYAARILSYLALGLIIIASIAASVFATRAGLTSQRRLMDVLHQVGAPPRYTAQLLSTRFAISGFKAGAMGAIAALLVSVLVGMLFSTSGGFSYFLPGLHLSLTDIFLVIAVPSFLALIITVTSWRTVLKTLYGEIYP
jgi:cell division transport system permease protein